MSKEKYTLQEVTTPALEREWLDFPKRIYKGNRNWVCPLDVDVLEVFNPSKNELFADGEAIRWVARDARGELVGRIAAFYNREKAAIEEQPTGGCGFFGVASCACSARCAAVSISLMRLSWFTSLAPGS